MFLRYEEYVRMGGGADESAFPMLEAKARAQLNRMTFGRLEGNENVSENVKYCMMELMAAIEAEESMGSLAAGREISGMSNDGVSISFATSGSGGARTSAAKYAAIARGWLANETTACGIPLMYAGVRVV